MVKQNAGISVPSECGGDCRNGTKHLDVIIDTYNDALSLDAQFSWTLGRTSSNGVSPSGAPSVSVLLGTICFVILRQVSVQSLTMVLSHNHFLLVRSSAEGGLSKSVEGRLEASTRCTPCWAASALRGQHTAASIKTDWRVGVVVGLRCTEVVGQNKAQRSGSNTRKHRGRRRDWNPVWCGHVAQKSRVTPVCAVLFFIFSHAGGIQVGGRLCSGINQLRIQPFRAIDVSHHCRRELRRFHPPCWFL